MNRISVYYSVELKNNDQWLAHPFCKLLTPDRIKLARAFLSKATKEGHKARLVEITVTEKTIK